MNDRMTERQSNLTQKAADKREKVTKKKKKEKKKNLLNICNIKDKLRA